MGPTDRMVEAYVRSVHSTETGYKDIARNLRAWGVVVIREDHENRIGPARFRPPTSMDVWRRSSRTFRCAWEL